MGKQLIWSFYLRRHLLVILRVLELCLSKRPAEEVDSGASEAMHHLAFIGKTRILLCSGLEGT